MIKVGSALLIFFKIPRKLVVLLPHPKAKCAASDEVIYSQGPN